MGFEILKFKKKFLGLKVLLLFFKFGEGERKGLGDSYGFSEPVGWVLKVLKWREVETESIDKFGVIELKGV